MKGLFFTLLILLAGLAIWFKWVGPMLDKKDDDKDEAKA